MFEIFKGSAVVRMLTYILGQKTFNQALTVIIILFSFQYGLLFYKFEFKQAYFDKFKYQNVDQYDLWTALKDVCIK